MILLLLYLYEIVPAYLNPKLPQVVYFANSTEGFDYLDAYYKQFPEKQFYFLNATLHAEFAKNASIPIPSIALSTALGIQVALEISSIPSMLQYIDIEPSFDGNTFFAADEEDMVLTSEEFGGAVLFYYVSNQCKNCEYQLLQVMQIAYRAGRRVIYVNCDGSRELYLTCSRRVIRGFPWIEVLHDNQLYAISQLPTADVYAQWAEKLLQEKFEGKSEPFSRQWFAEHKTKYAEDGHPLEFPVKPDVIGLEAKLDALEARVSKLLGRT